MSKYKEAMQYFNDKSNFRYDGTEYNPVAYAHHWIAVEEALEIADRLEKANANKTLYDYCIKCGMCTQLNDACKYRKNIHIGYDKAIADIRGDTE